MPPSEAQLAPTEAASGRRIRLAVVDKSPLIRLALLALLAGDARFELVWVCEHGDRLLEALPELELDVVVTGWVMPQADGRYMLERLRAMGSPVRVVVYTGAANPRVPAEVMALGGAGFCAKTESPEHLLEMVAAAAAGRMVFPFMDVRNLLDDGLPSLTKREHVLLDALIAGGTNAQLADQLGVSVNTVKFHLGNLYDKLDVRNRAQAVALFLAHRPPCQHD